MKRTWDGAPVSPEEPFGATVVVYRGEGDALRFLILHRTYAGPDYEGEWAWTPPSGARFPGEAIETCARRELEEETGLVLPIQPTACGTEEWPVFLSEAPDGVEVRLSPEHDRFIWMAPGEAIKRCTPALVAGPLRCIHRLLGGV